MERSHLPLGATVWFFRVGSILNPVIDALNVTSGSRWWLLVGALARLTFIGCWLSMLPLFDLVVGTEFLVSYPRTGPGLVFLGSNISEDVGLLYLGLLPFAVLAGPAVCQWLILVAARYANGEMFVRNGHGSPFGRFVDPKNVD